MNGAFYRGEVYYVRPTGTEVGCEQRAGRPGIIVSCNQNNKNSSVVEVVYLTTREKKPMPTHIRIGDTAKIHDSTAICEQIFTVDKLRLDECLGTLSAEEMDNINLGLIAGLGLDNYIQNPKPAAKIPEAVPLSIPAPPVTPNPVVSSFVDARKEPAAGGLDNSVEFMRVCAQRDVYKDLLMEIINKKV